MADGDVEITIGSKEDRRSVVLRCTPRAARRISDAFGGFGGAFPRLAAFDLAAYCLIVAAGLGSKSKPVNPSDVEDEVFAAGLVNLTSPLSDYLALMSNGGRSADEEKKDAPPKGED